jgi:hypothetical protein
MGVETSIWYTNQALYLKKALSNGVDFDKAYMLTKVWFNATKCGCVYRKKTEDMCWKNCPDEMKDEHLGVFKVIPKH